MSVGLPSNAIRRLGALVIAAAACASAVGCAGEAARVAPYRVRPDSVEAGSLYGPFTGRVTDAASGAPVAGALVYATWSLASGYGLTGPGGVKEVVVSTDTDGRYRIDRLRDLESDGASRLTDFHVVVYKRGYVAYRSDRRFFDLGPRQDFAQLRNEIALERWRREYSHLRHVRYVGGGAALAALTAWETDEAAAELSGIKKGEPSRLVTEFAPSTRSSSVVAAQLLTEKEVKEITGFDGSFETGPLGDEPDTDAYSSQHFKALGRPQTYDVALRLWKLAVDRADKRYQDITELLPKVEHDNDIADKSFSATEGSIIAVGYIDRRLGIVVMVSCGQAQCSDSQVVKKLAAASYDKLRRIMPKPGTTK